MVPVAGKVVNLSRRLPVTSIPSEAANEDLLESYCIKHISQAVSLAALLFHAFSISHDSECCVLCFR